MARLLALHQGPGYWHYTKTLGRSLHECTPLLPCLCIPTKRVLLPVPWEQKPITGVNCLAPHHTNAPVVCRPWVPTSMVGGGLRGAVPQPPSLQTALPETRQRANCWALGEPPKLKNLPLVLGSQSSPSATEWLRTTSYSTKTATSSSRKVIHVCVCLFDMGGSRGSWPVHCPRGREWASHAPWTWLLGGC